jgi:16S rRNA (guanine527-N7)-methyltransferase
VDLDPVRAALAAARALGFAGPGDPERQLRHALALAAAAESILGRPPASFADLGSGGGAPGLVLAAVWPDATGTLVESQGRRAAHLDEWVGTVGAGGRVVVVRERAEELAHDPAHRERYELVTARGFAPPAVTAEVAAGFVRPGGVVVVSEPPGGEPARWRAGRLDELGLAPARLVRSAATTFACLRKERATPQRWPRRRGRPWKRPLW